MRSGSQPLASGVLQAYHCSRPSTQFGAAESSIKAYQYCRSSWKTSFLSRVIYAGTGQLSVQWMPSGHLLSWGGRRQAENQYCCFGCSVANCCDLLRGNSAIRCSTSRRDSRGLTSVTTIDLQYVKIQLFEIFVHPHEQ